MKKKKRRSVKKSRVPSQKILEGLLADYQSGRYDKAKLTAHSVTRDYPENAFCWKVLGALLNREGDLQGSTHAFRRALKISPDDPEAHNNLGAVLQARGSLAESEMEFMSALTLRPDYVEALDNLARTRKLQGKSKEAEDIWVSAITVNPDYAPAHFNLACLQGSTGRLREAEAGYRKAISLKPELSEAHNNLGVLLKRMGSYDEAALCLRKAISLEPLRSEYLANLGNNFLRSGKAAESLEYLERALKLDPHSPILNSNFAVALTQVSFTAAREDLYTPILNLLKKRSLARPEDIATAVLSLLFCDPNVKRFLKECEKISLENILEICSILESVPLLCEMLKKCPLPNLKIEKALVNLRKFFLKNVEKIYFNAPAHTTLTSLAIHCFVNEFIYFETEEESKIVLELHKKIIDLLSSGQQPTFAQLACFSTYRPLSQQAWVNKLHSLESHEELRRILIDEPRREAAILEDIPLLAMGKDEVSIIVRAQYEANPYPRWTDPALSPVRYSLSEYFSQLELDYKAERVSVIESPEVLVAGCGTGRHSIESASRYANCNVIAVDLSLASLSYAIRKTEELAVKNIKYFQADILNLEKIDRTFDTIESVGVLHHMSDPMLGWRVLANLLRPGGMMKIGLYSDIARTSLRKLREQAISEMIQRTPEEIRLFRKRIIDSADVDQLAVFESMTDMFSISEMRDLIFHVQEHRFTIPEIKEALNELNLTFCGFVGFEILHSFKATYGSQARIYDLDMWHEFEKAHPETFISMYQFWCQKVN